MAKRNDQTDLWVPLAAAARRLGTTEVHLLMQIRAARLVGREEQGAWFVTEASIDRFRSDPGGRKMAAGCGRSCSGNHCTEPQ